MTFSVKRPSWILGMCAIVASCSALGDVAIVEPIPGGSTTSTSTSIAAFATAETEETAATPEVANVKALVLANGVIVPVLHERADDYSIHTPCGVAAFVEKSTSIKELGGADIVLDPGHGGDIETGAVGPNGLTEKELNLEVAFAAKAILDDLGYDVVMTRTDDYRVPLKVRAEIANLLDARVFVSIHHNAPNANPSPVPGTEVFVQSGSDESRRLGGLVYEHVVDALDNFAVGWVRASDAGALEVINDRGTDSYSMVRRPLMPAVLAELAYISNESEAQLMATDIYVDAAANALAGAIDAYFTTDELGSGFVDTPRTFTPNGLTGGLSGCVDTALGEP
ncbi:MAG: N-acetylmuramoyl-L-alanine amidase [Acidimicrobiales bacterium]